MSLLRWLCGVWVLGAPWALLAQQPNLRHFTTNEGLPQSQVLAVFQDSVGYLWFGNYGGVSRFNGVEFRNFTTADGLTSNTVSALAEDEEGRLAIATLGGGVCFLDNEEITCESSLVGQRIVDVVLDPRGALWLAGPEGLSRIHAGAIRKYTADDGLPSNNCLGLAATASGELWVATEGGLARRREDRFEAVDGPAAVTVLHYRDGVTWAASENEIFRYHDDIWSPLKLPEQLSQTLITDLAADGAGNLWIASHAGAWSFDGHDFDWFDSQNGLLADYIEQVLVDREGVIWLATDHGATKIVPGPFSAWDQRSGLPSPVVRAIAEDETGDLWVGTRDGLAIFRGDRFEPRPIGGLSDPRIYSLSPIPGGGMLAGSRDGLVAWRPDGAATIFRQQQGLPSDYTPSLLAAAEGPGTWVGTDRGLVHFHHGAVRRLADPQLNEAYILSMAYDSDGRLWLGLQTGGLLVAEIEDGEPRVVRQIGRREGLTDLTIWSLAVDESGRMWAGSNGDGAFLIDESSVRQVSTREGLVNNFVWQVLCDAEGFVWLFTNQGLNRFDGAEFALFSEGDGLPNLEGTATAALQDRSGRLWFGTADGLLRYDHDQEVEGVEDIAAMIEQVQSGAVPLASGANLEFGFAPINLRFSALSFRQSEVEFRHRLMGLGSELWSAPSSLRTVSLVGLPPGDYRFEVRAGSRGQWGQGAGIFTFSVLPAFHHTWWFRVGLALLGLTTTLLVVRGWTSHLRRDRSRLESLATTRAEELAEKQLSLQHEIAQRSQAQEAREHLEERLRQSEKMEAIGRLAGGVAHDFNNLLTTILGYGDLLKDSLEQQPQLLADVEEIRHAAQRASALTGQLLAFSRKQVIEPRLLSLHQVIRDTSGMLKPLLGADVELHLDLQANRDIVRADQTQIEQVLVNLAVNGRDSMPHGGKLTVSTVNGPALATSLPAGSGYSILLTFADTGEGMAPEIMEHIFEPFFTTKPRGEGTGLGLATVYGILHQNGGTIVVDSSPGEGTVFTVSFPGADGQLDDSASGEAETLATQTGETVLVVEDEEALRNLLIGLLFNGGYEVIAAADGQSAIELFETHGDEIDLLLTDIVMPGMDGRDVAQRILSLRPALPVLYFSGYAAEYLSRRGLLDPGAPLLAKPFTAQQLLTRMRQILDEDDLNPMAPVDV